VGRWMLGIGQRLEGFDRSTGLDDAFQAGYQAGFYKGERVIPP
jgi:hypothetical protein